jgi:hypothetical protein
MTDTTPNRTLPNRWILALAGAGIFLAGLLIGTLSSGGSLFAASSSPSHASAQNATAHAAATPGLGAQDAARYCATYEQTVEQETGLSAATLEKANYDGLVAVLDQMVKDGKMTADQEAQIKQQLDQLKSAPCDHLAQLGKGAAPTSAQQQALTNARSAIVAAVANALHLTPDALQADLKAGQTIPAIATAQHVSLDTVNTAYLDAVDAQIDTAVNNKLLTTPQAGQLKSMIAQAVAAGHYPLLEGGAYGA